MHPIAALYVQTGGAYFDLLGVDPWDEARDPDLYDLAGNAAKALFELRHAIGGKQ